MTAPNASPVPGCAAPAGAGVLAGNGLPLRWQGRDTFTILETRFGLGGDFLATWDAWRRDPQRCARLIFVAVEPRPPGREVLRTVRRDSPFADLANRLADAWPAAATPDLHRIAFDAGSVELLLAFGAARDWLPDLEISVDAFFLDGAMPAADPGLRDGRLGKALGRLAAQGATLAARPADPALRAELTRAGFVVDAGDCGLAVFRPVHRTPLAGRRAPRPPSVERRVLIVGGGLAGTAAAWALAERGWRSTLFDRHPRLAGEASGNPGGLFHGSFHAQDGAHARFSRAAALAVRPEIERAISAHGVEGAAHGFLRLESRLALPVMRTLLARAGLPPEYIEAVDADAASALAHLRLGSPAWHYPGGGWVDPAGLSRAYAERAGARLERRLGIEVASIRSTEGGRWQLLDAAGLPIDEADTLLLANAADAVRLLGGPRWPVERLRGQISVLAAGLLPEALRACRLPVAGGGYLIPAHAGLLFGATRQRDDDDPAVRRADHVQNLARLESMLGAPLGLAPDSLTGRTAWRTSAVDRLPWVGAVPALDLLRGEPALEPRWAQARHVPREPGLFIFAALGSRGITASALGAHVVAAGIAGTAPPLAAGLLDAIDPARFVSREVRSGASRGSPGSALSPAFRAQGAGCP